MTDSAENCPFCGAPGVGGKDGCELHFDEIRYQMLTDIRIAAVHRLAFDAYCMQHVERYCVSAKSYAAHLIGLCIGVEFSGQASLYAAIPRGLNGKVAIEKPPLLNQRGAMTIVDILAASAVPERAERMRAYAQCVWDAYGSQHVIARALLNKITATG